MKQPVSQMGGSGGERDLPPLKRALVVEGGGMRGAHTCGVIMAMVDVGLTNFDVVVGTSAGACSAAFLVSRQFDRLPVVWTNYLHGERFISLRKLGSSESVMNLDYLIHEVFDKREPLDVEAIKKSRTDFFITATSCETGQAVYFSNRKHSILHALKASSALPIAYRYPVVIDGHSYLDGGITDPIPIQKAIDEGCDEIFVVLTQPPGYRKKTAFLNILPRLYQKKYPKLSEALARRNEVYDRALDRLERKDYPAKIHILRPGGKLPIKRLTTKIDRIREAIAQGFGDGLYTLSQVSLSFPQVEE